MTYFDYDEPRKWDQPTSGSATVGPAITQVVMIALLSGPFFMLGDSILETGIRVIILYMFFEATRRLSQYLYAVFIGESSISKTFVEGRPEYNWIMAFLAEEKLYRKFPLSTGTIGGSDMLPLGKPRSLRWNGFCLEATRTGYEHFSHNAESVRSVLRIKIYTFKVSAMSEFLEEMKNRYMNASCPDVVVYSMNQGTNWGSPDWNQKRTKPTSSLPISLPDDEMDLLVHEAREFFDSSEWYIAAGVPWRKTYLLHGPEETSPANIALALGAKLRREVYHINLMASDIGFTNGSLLQAICNIPKGSIFVLEDIDKAYFAGTNPASYHQPQCYNSCDTRLNVTPSGIWDALRGYAREQGILVFGITVDADRIPKSLFESGTIDRKIESKYASKQQIVSVFNRFFPTTYGIPQSATVESFATDVKIPLLANLAEEFASQVPENEFAISDLQRYLVPHRSSPGAAIAGIAKWVEWQLEDKRVKLEEKARRLHVPPHMRSPWDSPVPLLPPFLPAADPASDSDDDDHSSVGDKQERKPIENSLPIGLEAPGVPFEWPILASLITPLEPSAPALDSANVGQSKAVASDDNLADLPELQREIVKFIKGQPPNTAGVPVHLIAHETRDMATDALSVHNALDDLLVQGHIYTTIDDFHFNATI